MTDAIYITEVAPRDGLQNEKQLIATPDKVRLVRMLDGTGADEIEVSSFVSPKWVPQLADAADVFARVAATKPVGVVYSALVPNEKGMAGALAANAAAAAAHPGMPGGRRLIDRITLFTAASESFAWKNTNASIAETLERFKPVITSARTHGLNVRAYISTVIRCPYEGVIAPSAVANVAQRLLELGIDDIDLGDTIGAATPESTREMLKASIAAIGRTNIAKLTLHLHDTFGRAAECVPVALELGLRSFDGAAGGLGGCPYASTPGKRAPGNLATETLVRAIQRAGYKTGVNLETLESAGRFARALVSTEPAATALCGTMVREALSQREFGATPRFRWRGRDVSRVEGLSDAVLGFAITLIVVSLEVPRSFDDLLRVMRGVPAFAICFVLLLQVWYRHYIYFRRYGLNDLPTIALNGLLLFIILIYVYPLKFLFTMAVGMFTGAADLAPMNVHQAPLLFTIYGLGFMAIFGTFALLYWRALRKRRELELNELEVFETRLAIVDNLLYASVGLISLALANLLPLRWVGVAGMSYALLGIVGFFVGWIGGNRRERIASRMVSVDAAGK